jgi:hypothetical protein
MKSNYKHIIIEPKPSALSMRLDRPEESELRQEWRLAEAAPTLLQALKRARNWIAMYDEDTSGEDPAAKVMLDAIDKALAEVI